MGRVLEMDTVVTFALHGGFLGLAAAIELGLATIILGIGAEGWPHAGGLVGWGVCSGLLQMVGETGWQLSHSERSRLYIARAL